jgi:hypothetical protein
MGKGISISQSSCNFHLVNLILIIFDEDKLCQPESYIPYTLKTSINISLICKQNSDIKQKQAHKDFIHPKCRYSSINLQTKFLEEHGLLLNISS